MATPLRHFTHQHPLGVVSYGDDFTCDGCHTLGAGERYHCQSCRFNLHKECAVSPANKSSHLHLMDHQLNRVWDNPEDTAAFSGHRPCNVCEEQVNGLYFACPDLLCNFVLHPICSNVPPSVRHVTDIKHGLTFQFAMESECNICRRNCSGWRYRCGPCCIDIHLECLLSPPAINLHDDNLSRSRSLGQSMDKSPPPLDHQNYSPQAARINYSVGMQSSSSSPLLYSLHHSHSSNGSQYIPYNKPAGGYGSAAGTGVGMTYSPSSPSYGNGALSPSSPSYGNGALSPSSPSYLQPFNYNHGPHKPDGSGPHGSPGGSQSGGKKKKMYAIVGQLVAMVAAQTIIGLIGGI